MARLIDADKFKQYIDNEECCEKCKVSGVMCDLDCEISMTMKVQWERIIDEQPTVDAVPVEWILNNERMPKEGRGREAIMDMLEDWRKEHDKAD